MTNALIQAHETALNELQAVKNSKGHIPSFRYNKLLHFTSDRCASTLETIQREIRLLELIVSNE